MVAVGTGPPNVLLAPKPTSSVRMRRTFGAPFGALTSCGKSLVDSSTVRPMCPLNGGSGRGNTSCACVAAGNNEITAPLTLASSMLRLFTSVSPSSLASRKSALRNAQNHSPLAASRSLPQNETPARSRFCYVHCSSHQTSPKRLECANTGPCPRVRRLGQIDPLRTLSSAHVRWKGARERTLIGTDHVD